MHLALIGTGLIGASAAWAMKKGAWSTRSPPLTSRMRTPDGPCKWASPIWPARALRSASQAPTVWWRPCRCWPSSASLHEASPFLADNTLITDVGSVRGIVIDGARRALGEKFGNYAAVHPIAGGEMPGVAYADPDLFVGARAISTPVSETSERALSFWENA